MTPLTGLHHSPGTAAFGLHRDLNRRARHPHSVLVFAVLFGNLVWVRHPQRGWEVPGGKVEQGETAVGAVHREAFEEAGVRLDKPTWLAEYFVHMNAGDLAKWVYLANVWDVGARPASSEIVDVRMFHPLMRPDEAQSRSDVSPIMQDDVYEKLWPTLKQSLACEGAETDVRISSAKRSSYRVDSRFE